MPDLSAMQVFSNEETLSVHAADLFVLSAREAIAARGRFTVALTGGSGPKKTYELLAREPRSSQIEWGNVFVFLGDDRFVPYDDGRSNFGMCRSLLLAQVPVPAGQIFPIPADTPTPEQAAAAYAETLSQVFALPINAAAPALDLILLGMGDDGHCASLFPGMPTLDVTDHWVVSSPPGTLPPPVDRVTFTFPVLNAARQVVFLVNGEKKAPAVHDIFEGGATRAQHPSAGVNPAQGTLTWLLDEAAASRLKKK